MNRQAIHTLIKDIILAVVSFLIAPAVLEILNLSFGLHMMPLPIVLKVVFLGIPFGWRWATKIITAVSFHGILIKLIFACTLALPAFVVVIGGDIIRCFIAPLNDD